MPSRSEKPSPNVLDRLFQVAYWVAFRAALVLWFLTRPAQNGYLVVIWHGGRALLIRNSYHSLWSAPGGSAKAGESAEEAASRETKEEIGIPIRPTELKLGLDVTHAFRFRRDRVQIFTWQAADLPALAFDCREVVAGEWFTPEEALSLPLIPHLRSYFEGLHAGLAGPA